jgi:hypothetical protein
MNTGEGCQGKTASPLAADPSGGAVEMLRRTNLTLTVLPPAVQMKGAGTCLWVHDEALTRIQRFRGSVYEDQGEVPLNAVRVGRRYTLSCDSQNFHLVLNEPSGALAACLRFRYHPASTTASGLKMFEAVRRMAPSEGVAQSSAINTILADSRSRGLWVVEMSGLAVARAYWDSPVVRLLTLSVLALVRYVGDGIVLGQIPDRPGADAYFEGYERTAGSLVHLDSTRVSGRMEKPVEELRASLLLTHPHLAGCRPEVAEPMEDGLARIYDMVRPLSASR